MARDDSRCDAPGKQAKALLATEVARRCRLDVHARKRTGGYSPVKRPIGATDIARHVEDDRPLGCYLLKQDRTEVAVFDLDDHEGEVGWDGVVAAVAKVMAAALAAGVRPLPFRSGGGKGAHLWVNFDGPQKARNVRRLMAKVLAEIGFKDGTGGVINGEVEIFPKQDRVAQGEFGNLIALPGAGQSAPLHPQTLQPMEWDDLDVAAIMAQVSAAPPEAPEEDHHTASGEHPPGLMARVAKALTRIPADGYDPWLKVAFALKHRFGDGGFDLFDEWSATCPEKYTSTEETRRFWDRLKPDGRSTIGAIYRLAGGGDGEEYAPPERVFGDPWVEAAEVPSFPIDTLPEPVRRYVDVRSRALGGDPAGVAIVALAVAGGALDQRVLMLPKPGDDSWEVRPGRTWPLLVATSGSRKSWIVSRTIRPVQEAQRQARAEHREKVRAWKKAGSDPDQNPEDEKPPTYAYAAATVEKLVAGLSEQDRAGMLFTPDEASGFIDSWGQYSGRSKADEAFWLAAADGRPYLQGRIAAGDRYVPLLAATVILGIQDEMLGDIRKLANSGMLQRFSPIVLGPPRLSEAIEASDAYEAWDDLVNWLLSYPPRVFVADQEATAIFMDFEAYTLKIQGQKGLSLAFRSWVGKLGSVHASLALVFCLLRQFEYNQTRQGFLDGVEETRAELFGAEPKTRPKVSEVIKIDADRATRVVKAFLVPHALCFFEELLQNSSSREVLQRMVGYVLNAKDKSGAPKNRLTRSDFTNHIFALRDLKPRDLDDQIARLVNLGHLDPEFGPKGGPPIAWTVAPGLREHFAERAKIEAERQAEVTAMFADLRRGRGSG